MNYFSMFSGIGGFELGIQQTIKGCEWNCIGFSEIDRFAVQVYNKHFKHKNFGDAKQISWGGVQDFDCLVAGFPCQAFSLAGKRRGFNDTRGTLFFEIARCLEAKQPRMFVLENVKGLLNHDKGETFTTILKTIDELGYDAEWQILNSKHFRVPHGRQRLFIIGYKRGFQKRIYPLQPKTICESPRFFYITPQRIVQRQQGHYKRRTCFTLTGRDTHGVEDGMGVRNLTPVECERLQGFPDNWTEGISEPQRRIRLGNAVTVNVIKTIFKKIGET